MTAADPRSPGRQPPPGAVIFDWDNTLVDSWSTIHDALNMTFAVMGTPQWTLDQTMSQVRHSLRDSFPQLFGSSWEDARRLYLANFEAIHLDRLMPLPGAEALLGALDRLGLYVAVVSNKTGRLLRCEVSALGWEPLFARVIGAGDAVADKPDRAPVDMALDSSGIQPGPRVWFVGDTDIDMECAANAGCLPVLIAPQPAEWNAFAVPPSIWFESCSALRDEILSSSHLQYDAGMNKLDGASSP